MNIRVGSPTVESRILSVKNSMFLMFAYVGLHNTPVIPTYFNSLSSRVGSFPAMYPMPCR